jgi:enoyl-CoA hydratase/carnithine racemase
MQQDAILYSASQHIARITLNSPSAHNALGNAEVEHFHDLLTAVERDTSLRVLLLGAAGDKTFCAGASLKQMSGGTMSGDIFTTLTDRLAALRIPSICALNGNVFGGGGEIALCCDYRIGVAGMRLLVPAARIGICYPENGMRRYVEKLGLDAALRILVAAEELPAETLLAIGYLHRLVEREQLAAEAQAFAVYLAGLAPLAVQSMKPLLLGIARGDPNPVLARESVARCAASNDLREGLAAQRERRAPRFEGT